MICTEMPEARFEDVVEIQMTDRTHRRLRLDDVFLQVCEPGSVKAVSACPSHAAAVGARIEGDHLVVEVQGETTSVTVVVSGVRKGHHYRFRRHTEDEMHKNESFWDGWLK
jgi:hypothetical protein